MGNTTRRQPVNFGIPSAPDYKFLNVVDFRGIDVSDNPFVVKQNTASDALNVYVDESNALTTRPRLNQEYQIPMALRADYVSTLFTYRLNNRVLFQCQMTDVVKFYLKYDTEDTVTEIVSDFTFDNTKYAVFEDNGKIYLANNNGYYVIKSDNKAYNVFGDDDTFVPITLTGSVATGKDNLHDIGQDNMLSPKYRVSYHWDLVSDYSDILADGGQVVENKYIDYRFLGGYVPSNVGPQQRVLTDTKFALIWSDMDWDADTIISGTYYIQSMDGYPFSDVSNDSDLPFKHNQQREIYKGITNIPEKLVGRKLSNFSAGVTQAVIPLYIKNNIVYFYYKTHARLSISEITNLSVGNTEIMTVKKYDKLKNDVQTTTIPTCVSSSPIASMWNDNLYLCTNKNGNVFVSHNNYDLLIADWSNENKPHYKIIPDFTLVVGGSNYVLKGLPKQQLHINNDASVVYGVFVNAMADASTTTDWIVVEYIEQDDGTFVEKKLYTNTDSSLTYYDINLFVSEDESKIVCLGGTSNKIITITKTQEDSTVVNVLTADELTQTTRTSLSNNTPLGSGENIAHFSLFSADVSRFIIWSDSHKKIHSFDIDFETHTITHKNITLAITPYRCSLSEDGTKIGFIASEGFGGDLYRYYYSSDKTFYLCGTAEEVADGFMPLGVLSDSNTMFGMVIFDEWFTDYPPEWGFNPRKVYISELSPSIEPLLIVEYPKKEVSNKQSIYFNGFLRFDNNYLFYGVDNKLYITNNNDPTYISRSLQLGKTEDPITDMLLIAYDTAMAFKEKSMYIIQPLTTDTVYGYQGIEAKSNIGAVSPQAAIISPLNETPLYVGLTGVYAIQSLKNVQSTDKVSVLYSEAITNLKDETGELKFMEDLKKKNIISTKRLYWTLFIAPGEDSSNVYLLDDRTASWFVWNVPVKIVGCWAEEDVIYLADNNGKVYDLLKTDIINKYNPELTEYYDDGEKLINWYWKSQILPMGTINYSKKLIDTTFILSDTDSMDEYGLNYKYRIFRKSASETKETTIQNDINYVQSTTKRTLIPRFNFIQLELSNIEDDLNNNKLRLIGLGLKYVLLEGLY